MRLFNRSFHYHVSYTFYDEIGGSGNGSTTITITGKMNTTDDVKEVAAHIELNHNMHNVVINNWIRLKS